MRVIGRKVIEKFRGNHADERSSLDNWYAVVASRSWKNFVELRQVFPSAGNVGPYVVFNVGGINTG